MRYRRLALLSLLLNYGLFIGFNIYQKDWLLLFSTFLWIFAFLGLALPFMSLLIATVFAFIPFNNWSYIDRQKRLTWLILLGIKLMLGRKILNLIFS